MPAKNKDATPDLLRGSLVKLRRKCGKPTCRCAKGKRHESWVLSYSVRSRTRMLLISPFMLAHVRQALKQYRQARQRLEREALSHLALLRARLANDRKVKS